MISMVFGWWGVLFVDKEEEGLQALDRLRRNEELFSASVILVACNCDLERKG